MRDIGFLLLFFAAVIPALTNMSAAILLWIWVSMLGPSSFMYSFGQDIPFSKLAVFGAVLALLISREKKRLHMDTTSVLIVLFLGIATLSQITSITDSELGWSILNKLWKIILLNLAIASFMRSRVRLHAMLLTICISMGVTGYSSGLKFIVLLGHYKFNDFPPWGDNNHVGLIVLMSIPLLQYLAAYSSKQLVKISFIFAMLLSFACVIATNSRGAFLGMIVVILYGLRASKHRIRYAMIVAATAAALAPIVAEKWVSRIETIQAADQDNSFMGRVIAWKISTLIALEHPMLGGGLHSVQMVPVWMAFRQHFDTLSFISTDSPGEWPRAAHSIYFEVLGDTGFGGFLIFIAILISTLRNTSYVMRVTRNEPGMQWARDMADSLRLGIVVFMISGAALSATYHDINFIFFGLISALRGTVNDRLQEAAKGSVTPSQTFRSPMARRLA